MQIQRLFGVLVLGGSALAGGIACGGGGGDSDPAESDPDALGAGSVSEEAGEASPAETGQAPGGEMPMVAEKCLCGEDDCCEEGENGVSEPKAGIECCWGTSC